MSFFLAILPNSLPTNVRLSFSSPNATLRGVFECAIICAAFIFPHSDLASGESFWIRSTISLLSDGLNMLFMEQSPDLHSHTVGTPHGIAFFYAERDIKFGHVG